MTDRVTVVIVNYNAGAWLARCVGALLDSPDPPALIVFDNASSDNSLAELPADREIQVVRSDRNRGFGQGVNRAMENVTTPAVLVLNPDCLINSLALGRLVEILEADDGLAMVGGRVFNADGSEQRASRRRLPTPSRVINEFIPPRRRAGLGVDLSDTPAPEVALDVEALSGACMLIRTRPFRQLGGFDEGFRMHFEDLDLMARLGKAGWRIRLVPEVIVEHAGGVSSRQRRLAVHWAKHASLWRYLVLHCRDEWPVWSRPAWAIALWAHAVILAPIVWLRGRLP